DVKPDNFIIFPGNIIKITDFGIARFATQTVRASGSGTVGYLSPEQALGKPSLKSDVFSLGLIIYEMLSKHLPEWPFDWPPPDIEKLRRKLPDYFIKWLRKALEVNTRKRFSDAEEMQKQFEKVMARYERQK
ncbi:MAG: serine/threonine protein kinase, partial [Candidatus Sumerlaeota bacterium]